jgi:hypothetical protein
MSFFLLGTSRAFGESHRGSHEAGEESAESSLSDGLATRRDSFRIMGLLYPEVLGTGRLSGVV